MILFRTVMTNNVIIGFSQPSLSHKDKMFKEYKKQSIKSCIALDVYSD